MSDMTFKQAKEIIERLELAELSLKNSFDSLDDMKKALDDSIVKGKSALIQTPSKDKKVSTLYLIIMLNIGFIAGLLVGRFLF